MIVKEFRTVERLAICGLLIALGVVLAGPLEIPINFFGAYTVSLSFGSVPVFMAAVMFGPIYGAMVGGLWDLLQALIFPMGAYNPLFTLSAVVMGGLAGLFFMKKKELTFVRILIAVAVAQIVASVILSSIWMVISYGTPLEVGLLRGAKAAVFIPIFALLVWLITTRLFGKKTQ